MAERYNIHSQLEHLQSKYIGTGHADTTKFEWMTNQHRDTNASHMGHFDMVNFFALAENESKARVKFKFDWKNAATVWTSAREKNRRLNLKIQTKQKLSSIFFFEKKCENSFICD